MAAMRLPAIHLPHRRLSTLGSIASLAPRRHIVVAMAAKRSPKRLKYSTPRFTKEGELVYIEVDPCGVDAWKLQPVIELLKQGAVGVIPTDTVYAIACDCKNHSAVERLRRIKKIESSKVRDMPALSPIFLFLLFFHGNFMQPLSILCPSFRDIDTYTMGFPHGDAHGHANVFRAVKQCLPGPVSNSIRYSPFIMRYSLSPGLHDPLTWMIYWHMFQQYTFILTASKELPKQCVGYGTTSVKYASRKNVGVRISDDAVCQTILQELDFPLICTSVKGTKENEWMIDPTAIGDIYGPEGLDFVVDGGVRVAEPSTIVDMTGSYPKVIREGKGPILPWMVLEDDESHLRQDLIASGT